MSTAVQTLPSPASLKNATIGDPPQQVLDLSGLPATLPRMMMVDLARPCAFRERAENAPQKVSVPLDLHRINSESVRNCPVHFSGKEALTLLGIFANSLKDDLLTILRKTHPAASMSELVFKERGNSQRPGYLPLDLFIPIQHQAPLLGEIFVTATNFTSNKPETLKAMRLGRIVYPGAMYCHITIDCSEPSARDAHKNIVPINRFVERALSDRRTGAGLKRYYITAKDLIEHGAALGLNTAITVAAFKAEINAQMTKHK